MRKTKDILLIIVIVCLIFSVRFVTEKNVIIRHGEIFYLITLLILLLGLYHLTKKKYKNMLTFYILSFLLFGLLPYFHFVTYTSNINNYSFDTDYLSQNIKNYKDELKNYGDSTTILDLKTKFDRNNLTKLKATSFENEKMQIEDYTIILNLIKTKQIGIPGSVGGRPNDRDMSKRVIDIYQLNKKITSFELNSDNLFEEFETYLIEKDLIQRKIKNPQRFIEFNDIWIDSVSGFVFSYVKPISRISQIIRLTQLIIAFLLFYMISSWLKYSPYFNISKMKK